VSTCLSKGCGKAVKARGLCDKHYQQAWNAGMIDEFPTSGPGVELDGPPLCRCPRPVLSRCWGQECTRCHMVVFATWPEDRQARCRVRWPNFMALIADQVIADVEGDELEGVA
jgi:hypothetical protein